MTKAMMAIVRVFMECLRFGGRRDGFRATVCLSVRRASAPHGAFLRLTRSSRKCAPVLAVAWKAT